MQWVSPRRNRNRSYLIGLNKSQGDKEWRRKLPLRPLRVHLPIKDGEEKGHQTLLSVPKARGGAERSRGGGGPFSYTPLFKEWGETGAKQPEGGPINPFKVPILSACLCF